MDATFGTTYPFNPIPYTSKTLVITGIFRHNRSIRYNADRPNLSAAAVQNAVYQFNLGLYRK